MTHRDLLKLTLYWIVERFELGDRDSLAEVGVNPKSLAWLTRLRALDIASLVSKDTVEVRIVIKPAIVARLDSNSVALQEWFLLNGAPNEMMRFLFPMLKEANLRGLRQSLELPQRGGRPKTLDSLSVAEVQAIVQHYRGIEPFRLNLPSCWTELFQRLEARYPLRELWDVVNDVQSH